LERITIRPDIVIEKIDENLYYLHTNGKNIDRGKPFTLRQMYVYNECWKSSKSLINSQLKYNNILQEDFILLIK
jgi:5-methylcytosine-specific restriction enzyme subunit McrC